MRFFPRPVELGEKEGFAAEKDIFQRAAFGEGLANLIAVSEYPLVIVLDAPWGSGKTTFIKMWAGLLRQREIPVIYFDAFENDHVENGFIAIAAEVIRLSKSMKKTGTKAHKSFVKKAARAGGVLLRTGAKIGVKAATLGAIDAADLEALKSVADDVAKETSTKADEYLEAILKLQSQEQETISGLRASLGELANSLTAPEAEGQKQKPLVFIIDELDRCKPPFALELLEKIKHIFSIQNVHFVLVTHLHQLENSVRFNYGNQIDAKTYLQKFYNILFNLPEQSEYRHERIIPKYVDHLCKRLSLKPDVFSILTNIAEARQLSLRAIERAVSYVALARAFTPENYLWLEPIVTGLAMMKVLDPEMFRKARNGTLTIAEVKTVLGLDRWPEDTSSDWTLEWWIYCLADNEEEYPKMDWAGFRGTLFRYSLRDRKQIIGVMANHLERLQLPKA